MRRLATALVAGIIISSAEAGAVALAGAASASVAPSAAVTREVTAAPAGAAQIVLPAATKYKFRNCTAMNKVYPHGVGKKGARDHTSGTPVTTFTASTSLYKKIIGHRGGLDRDHDGIACERA